MNTTGKVKYVWMIKLYPNSHILPNIRSFLIWTSGFGLFKPLLNLLCLNFVTNICLGLIADAGALAISGQAGTPAFLSLVQNLFSESNHLVWTKILGPIGTIKSVFYDDETISDGMKAFVLKLVTPAVEKIGWEQPADEDFLKSQLRPLLILSAGINGHKE